MLTNLLQVCRQLFIFVFSIANRLERLNSGIHIVEEVQQTVRLLERGWAVVQFILLAHFLMGSTVCNTTSLTLSSFLITSISLCFKKIFQQIILKKFQVNIQVKGYWYS